MPKSRTDWIALKRTLAASVGTLSWAVAALGWLTLAALPVAEISHSLFAYTAVAILFALRRKARTQPELRLAFLALAGLLSARYIVWRASETLVVTDILSTLAMLGLFLAELYAVAIFFLGNFVNLMPLDRRMPALPVDRARWPTVDVLVPSYDEDAALLETTLLAALNMRYAEGRCRVYLLDDGGTDQKCNDPDPAKATAARLRREKLQALCAKIGAHYLTRARNEHAKAGNLNAALPHIDGELIAVLDADHVPTVDFLERTVGAFLADDRLFLVQTPHFFINADPVEHNLRIFGRMPPENEMFYGAIQHGLDFWESSFFCGSAAVLRRAALDEVGGFTGQTITEDAETALELHSRGWRSAYYGRPLIAGLQPETYSGFITQRVRWAQGMTQILLLKNPLLRTGLKPWQKLAYFNSTLFWLFPYARTIFILVPSAWLIFGLQVYHANLTQFAAYTLPHLAGMLLAGHLLYGRVRWSFVSELYEMLQSFYSLRAINRVFCNPRAPRFKVTPKGTTHDEDFISSLVKPFYAFYGLAWVSLAFGVWRWFEQPMSRDVTLITLSWEVLNLLLQHGVLGAMYERRQRRGAPRVPAEERVRLMGTSGTSLDARILDVSATGLQLGVDSTAFLPAGRLHIEVTPAALGYSVQLPVSIAWQRDGALGLYFEPQDLAQKRAIVALAYGDSQRWRNIQLNRQEEADRLGVIGAFFRLVILGGRAAADHFTAVLARLSAWMDRCLTALARWSPSKIGRRENTLSTAGPMGRALYGAPSSHSIAQTPDLE
ncbi:MAG: UDP-forming cellulose synthase catalytic subunit [Tepidimonas sp.]|uniref:UDP-forming cellulose synthase catalytic subunit n=1 Tax=Tepidimonas sp. TaxID=2002775 RepID=UPI00259E1DEB|nr:UDP-forming cellulose synthase catalytic subunit [Tepidimonas sp.]MDM7456031.1 UDP-forming cellulose synthase catalytic subunit [Tepidimonas sp.]